MLLGSLWLAMALIQPNLHPLFKLIHFHRWYCFRNISWDDVCCSCHKLSVIAQDSLVILYFGVIIAWLSLNSKKRLRRKFEIGCFRVKEFAISLECWWLEQKYCLVSCEVLEIMTQSYFLLVRRAVFWGAKRLFGHCYEVGRLSETW